ncbi:hypothetical protein ACLK1T_03780 [Escherichia coli]
MKTGWMVLKGTADIPRLTVHRGSKYVVSTLRSLATSLKNNVINHCYAKINLKIFRRTSLPHWVWLPLCRY